MAVRASYEHLTEIGVFSCLTNKYALVGQTSSENYFSVLQKHLASSGIPVIHCTIGGTRNIGSCCVGNKHGLLVSNMCTDTELMNLRNKLPADVQVARIDERLSALGNIVACNDYVALVHPDIDRETQEIIQDTLKVQVFRTLISGIPLVGSCIRFTNRGGIVTPRVSMEEMNQLVELLEVPLIAGTVNNGSPQLSAGLIVNDWCAFMGQDSTGVELQVVEKIFQITHLTKRGDDTQGVDDSALRASIIDSLL